jgi:hypothetical protein
VIGSEGGLSTRSGSAAVPLLVELLSAPFKLEDQLENTPRRFAQSYQKDRRLKREEGIDHPLNLRYFQQQVHALVFFFPELRTPNPELSFFRPFGTFTPLGFFVTFLRGDHGTNRHPGSPGS